MVYWISAFAAKVKERVEETPPIELFLHPESVTPGPEIPAAGGTEPDAFHMFIKNIFWNIVTGRFLGRSHQWHVAPDALAEPIGMTGFQKKRFFQLLQLLPYAIVPDKDGTFQ